MGSGIRSLGSEAAIAERMAELSRPHVAPLTQLVEEMSEARPSASVPYFDPHSGGVRARILLLLEAPGPGAAAPRGSGFVSCENDDATAANLYELLGEAGVRIDRTRVERHGPLPG